MRFIGRLFVIFFAFLIACIAAGMTIGFGLVGTEWRLVQSDPIARGIFWVATVAGSSFTGAVSFLPLFLVAVMAEALRLRSILFYALAGVAIVTVAYYGYGFGNPYEESIDQPGPINHGFELALAAGVVFGFVYWLIAGRRAGAWHETPPG